jgi:hypothetical protein
MTGLTRGNGSIDGVFPSIEQLQASKANINTRVELVSGERYRVDIADAGGGLLLANGRYANLLPDTPVVLVTHAGGGVMTRGKINEIQDGDAGYTLPLASVLAENEFIVVTQSEQFVALEPLLSVSGTNTIAINGGTDTSVSFNQDKSVDLRLTSNGSNQYRLTVI